MSFMCLTQSVCLFAEILQADFMVQFLFEPLCMSAVWFKTELNINLKPTCQHKTRLMAILTGQLG